MKRAWEVGDFACAVESGWVGRIVALDTPEPGYHKLIGIDPILWAVTRSIEAATCEDDAQWFGGADLEPVGKRG